MKLEAKGKHPLEDPASTRSASSLYVPSLNRNWQRILGEARTRILLWYLLILGLVFLAGLPAFRYLLFQRVDAQVQRDMAEEIKAFRAMISSNRQFLQNIEYQDPENFERLQEYINATGSPVVPPNSSADLEEFFDRYLRHSIPGEHTFLITFIDGEFYKSTPRGRPKQLQRGSDLMDWWAKQIQPAQGMQKVSDPDIGNLLYVVEPVQIKGQIRGVFVVAYAMAGERAEIVEAMVVIGQVSLSLFMIAIVLAWFAAGRVLAPLRTITTTAQTISETDLSQRLSVRGKGELAELADTFNNMMDRLEIAFSSQREFVNDAGHELRTPITIIRGHLELMGPDPDEQQETLTIVVSELDRMSRLVNDMILLAKAERTDFLRLATVDAAELTEELFTKAQALAERDWQLDETARGQIVVDRERITEAMINLAQNATQHTQRGDTIAMGATIAKGKVRFWVRDTGEGIPLADQKRIFERFARAVNSRRRSEGAGLGLSIVRAIAEAHSGQVLLRSKLGSGSMFTLVLPLDPPQEMMTHVAYSHCRR
jgi:signal transduction histidine kinase